MCNNNDILVYIYIPVREKGGRRSIRGMFTERRFGSRSQHRRQAPSFDEFYARNDCRRGDALLARARALSVRGGVALLRKKKDDDADCVCVCVCKVFVVHSNVLVPSVLWLLLQNFGLKIDSKRWRKKGEERERKREIERKR